MRGPSFPLSSFPLPLSLACGATAPRRCRLSPLHFPGRPPTPFPDDESEPEDVSASSSSQFPEELYSLLTGPPADAAEFFAKARAFLAAHGSHWACEQGRVVGGLLPSLLSLNYEDTRAVWASLNAQLAQCSAWCACVCVCLCVSVCVCFECLGAWLCVYRVSALLALAPRRPGRPCLFVFESVVLSCVTLVGLPLRPSHA